MVMLSLLEALFWVSHIIILVLTFARVLTLLVDEGGSQKEVVDIFSQIVST